MIQIFKHFSLSINWGYFVEGFNILNELLYRCNVTHHEKMFNWSLLWINCFVKEGWSALFHYFFWDNWPCRTASQKSKMKSNHLKMCKTSEAFRWSRCFTLLLWEGKKKHFEFQATPDSWCKLVRPGAAHCPEQLKIFFFDRLLQSTLRFVCQLKSLPSACLKRLDMAAAHRHWQTHFWTSTLPPSPNSQTAYRNYRWFTFPYEPVSRHGAVFIGMIKSSSFRNDWSQSNLVVVYLVAGRDWSLCVPLSQTVVLHLH